LRSIVSCGQGAAMPVLPSADRDDNPCADARSRLTTASGRQRLRPLIVNTGSPRRGSAPMSASTAGDGDFVVALPLVRVAGKVRRPAKINLAPRHTAYFVSPLAGQDPRLDQRPARSRASAAAPNRPQFIRQHAVNSLRSCALDRHERLVIEISRRPPN
jgi:hypothetical protein